MKTDLGRIMAFVIGVGAFMIPYFTGESWMWSFSWLLAFIIISEA